MIRGSILIRMFLAIAVTLPATGITLTPGQLATAEERDDRDSTKQESGQPGNVEPEVYTVTTEYSVTHKGKDGKRGDQVKRRGGKSAKRGNRHVNADIFSRERNGTKVRLYPTLGVSDYGPWEDVRGRVESHTSARADDVRRMRIGGALLQSNRCADAYDDPDPVPTEKIFSGVRSGASPWTNYYRGFNDCWFQTGHNYFRIILENGKLWDDAVIGDVFIDL